MINLCIPAWIYLLAGTVRILWSIYVHTNIWVVLLRAALVLIWVYAVNLMCKSGYDTLAWLLVGLPIAILITWI